MSLVTKRAKPFHLCAYGTFFCGEYSQCQKTGFKWVKVEVVGTDGHEIAIPICEDHYEELEKCVPSNS